MSTYCTFTDYHPVTLGEIFCHHRTLRRPAVNDRIVTMPNILVLYVILCHVYGCRPDGAQTVIIVDSGS